MWKWFSRTRRRRPALLAGTPVVRRLKNYSACSGYVYQYYYLGYRVSDFDGATGTDYFFDVSADRKSFRPVRVFLRDASLREWERSRSHDLNSTERYAVAKMALFQAFDECEKPRAMQDIVCVQTAEVEELTERLGID